MSFAIYVKTSCVRCFLVHTCKSSPLYSLIGWLAPMLCKILSKTAYSNAPIKATANQLPCRNTRAAVQVSSRYWIQDDPVVNMETSNVKSFWYTSTMLKFIYIIFHKLITFLPLSKRSELAKRKYVVFQQDNARPQMSIVTPRTWLGSFDASIIKSKTGTKWLPRFSSTRKVLQ